MLSWDESRGADKERGPLEVAREEKVQPTLGGYFTVCLMRDWAEWFTKIVIFDREEEEEEEENKEDVRVREQ